MRKLIFGINVSIDGCCDHTKFNPDSDVHDYFAQLNREADILVYGRKTYDLMVPFWPDVAKNPAGHPKEMIDFAQSLDSVSRFIVFSKSLAKVEDKKTTIFRSNLREEILKLKQENGKSILTGGVDIPSQLIALGLVDEIYLVVHPLVVGEGRRLFDELDLEKNLDFKLAESKVFKSGAISLHYTKR